MMIERLNGRRAVAIAAGGLLLVVLIGWFGFVSPQRSKASDLSTQIDTTQAQLEVTQRLVSGSALRRSTAELAKLRLAIPDEVRMSQLLRQLSSASAKSHVRIMGITPLPVLTTGGADAVPLSVQIEGRYFGIRDFLRVLRTRADIRSDKVRASGRLFGVDSIQFTGDSTSGDVINAALAVTAFAYRGVVPAPSVDPDGTSSGVAVVDPAAEAATP